MEKENTLGVIKESIMVSGRLIKWMDKVLSHGLMVEDIKENIMKI